MVKTLQPGFDVARGIVCAALGHRAVRTQLCPFLRWLVLLAMQYCLDGAMHQQIGIAADRRSEMGIGS